MSSANEPIYPQHGVIDSNGNMVAISEWNGEVGLTKRDHFAGLAMSAIVSNQEFISEINNTHEGELAALVAKAAYEMSDAMVALSDKGSTDE